MERQIELDEEWVDWINHPKTGEFVEMLREMSFELMESIKRDVTDERKIGAAIGIDTVIDEIRRLKEDIKVMEDKEGG